MQIGEYFEGITIGKKMENFQITTRPNHRKAD